MKHINPKDFFLSEIKRTERYLESLRETLRSYLSLSPGGQTDGHQSRDINDPPVARLTGRRPERHEKTGKWATPSIELTAQVERIISNFEPEREFQITDIFSRLENYDGEKAEAVKGRISTILGRLMANPEKSVFKRKDRGVYIKKKS